MNTDLPFVVCFEVEPTAQGFDRYLAIAGSLRPALDRIPGFESIERSRSVNPGTRLLSLSYWGNQEAVASWRSHGAHHEAQIVGRNELFVDYRLRVGQVVRRWTPESIVTTAEPSTHAASWLGLLRFDGPTDALASVRGAAEFERYDSMVNPGRIFGVAALADEDAGRAIELKLAESAGGRGSSAARIVFDTCKIQRDYGRFERNQAPQYFPSIPQL